MPFPERVVIEDQGMRDGLQGKQTFGPTEKKLQLIDALVQARIGHFDTAFGGMGDCPFIRGASGNISTEDLVFMLELMGIATGADLDRVAAVSRNLKDWLDKRFAGKMHRLLERRDIRLLWPSELRIGSGPASPR